MSPAPQPHRPEAQNPKAQYPEAQYPKALYLKGLASPGGPGRAGRFLPARRHQPAPQRSRLRRYRPRAVEPGRAQSPPTATSSPDQPLQNH